MNNVLKHNLEVTESLTKKESLKSNNSLNYDERLKLQEKLKNPLYLPKSRAEIESAFTNGQEFNIFISDLTKHNAIYEFFHEEYINALAEYLAEQVKKLYVHHKPPFKILEVGAGNGKLSHFLGKKLYETFGNDIEIVATDDNSWNIEKTFTVEDIHYKDALEKHNPNIVICSWMPYMIDFTEDFRKCESVSEYILIGETDGGCCGHPNRTWGVENDFFSNSYIQTPFEEDGFSRSDLDFSSLQLCKADALEKDNIGVTHHSETVSFQRK